MESTEDVEAVFNKREGEAQAAPVVVAPKAEKAGVLKPRRQRRESLAALQNNSPETASTSAASSSSRCAGARGC